METVEWLSFVALSVLHLVTYIVILTRHAVPDTTRAFHVALTPPMLLGTFCLGLLAVMYRAELTALYGVPIEIVRITFIWTDIAWLSVLLFYSYWHFVVRGRRRPKPSAGAETTGERDRGDTRGGP